MSEQVEGFVLAGGASQRMGSDKASVVVRGAPMAAWVAGALSAVCGSVRLVRRSVDAPVVRGLDGVSLPVCTGREGDERHPLWGVAVAAEVCQAPWMMVAPCDLPWLDAEAVLALWQARGQVGAVAFDGERVHPLLAVLPVAHARAAGQIAAAGGSARAFVAALSRVPLDPEVLRNVNARSDLRPPVTPDPGAGRGGAR